MTDLKALLARVEVATGPDRELDRDLGFGLDNWERSGDADDLIYVPSETSYYPDHPGSMYPALTESIDAALALVERKLPGWTAWELESRGAKSRFVCSLSRLVNQVEESATGQAPTPPLAILAAFLRALTSEAP